ncbi:Oxygen-regulated invasion protein OrgA, partial [Salmonella enterica subsp. enterica serovar Inverness str. R8-3668]
LTVWAAVRAAANELILAAWRLKNGEKECIQNSLTQLWLRIQNSLTQLWAVAASVAPTAASSVFTRLP